MQLAETRGAHGLTNDELLGAGEHTAFNALVLRGAIVRGWDRWYAAGFEPAA